MLICVCVGVLYVYQVCMIFKLKYCLFVCILLLIFSLENVSILKESVKNKSSFYLFLIDRWELMNLTVQ